jgi:enamine deaminase RidA (YjgF/YER057c/UK114 family)
MNTAVNPPGYPVHPFYSQAIESKAANRMLFVAGQIGIGPDGMFPADIAGQAKNAFANMLNVLAAADMAVTDVVKVTIYLTDAANIEGFGAATAAGLPQPPPAATMVIVKALASPEMLVEIEAIAVK